MNRERRWALVWVLALLTVAPWHLVAAQEGPTLVILVRHAEKANVPGNDPSLSEAGQARAKALAQALEHARVGTVITSAFKRTVETGAIVAQTGRLTAQAIALEGGTPAHVAAVAAAVRASKGVVLVIGHSNTVPAIVAALGGPTLPDICDASYGTMFVMQPRATASPLAVMHYGAAEPDVTAKCPGMQPK